MRIDAYAQVQQVYQPRKVVRSRQTGASSHETDQLQLSTVGKDMQSVKAAVAAAPDIREDRVASIRARMENGTYHVDNSAFAEKLLQNYSEMR